VLGVRIKVRVKVQGNQQGGVTSSPLPSNLNSGVRAILGTIILERVRVRAMFFTCSSKCTCSSCTRCTISFLFSFSPLQGPLPLCPDRAHMGEVIIILPSESQWDSHR